MHYDRNEFVFKEAFVEDFDRNKIEHYLRTTGPNAATIPAIYCDMRSHLSDKARTFCGSNLAHMACFLGRFVTNLDYIVCERVGRELYSLRIHLSSITMAPVATEVTTSTPAHQVLKQGPVKPVYPQEDANFKRPPENTLRRYEKAGIDISRTIDSALLIRSAKLTSEFSEGYPYLPNKPEFVQDVEKLQTNLRDYVDPGTRADPEKKALFGAAKEVRDLSIHIGVRHLFSSFANKS
jgi:hypothetical protein